MGTYREQLLRENYGGGNARHLYSYRKQEEEPSGFLTMFKLRFAVCLVLFAAFAYLGVSGKSIFQVTAGQIRTAVVDEELTHQLAGWQEALAPLTEP